VKFIYYNNYNFENNCFAEAEIRYALEIIYPTKKDKDEIITEEPKMPTVTCIAKLNNYKKGTVTFEWEYCVSYNLNRYNYVENGKDAKGNTIYKKIKLCPRLL